MAVKMSFMPVLVDFFAVPAISQSWNHWNHWNHRRVFRKNLSGVCFGSVFRECLFEVYFGYLNNIQDIESGELEFCLQPEKPDKSKFSRLFRPKTVKI
jgi:hypothetical protein